MLALHHCFYAYLVQTSETGFIVSAHPGRQVSQLHPLAVGQFVDSPFRPPMVCNSLIFLLFNESVFTFLFFMICNFKFMIIKTFS